MRTINIKTAIIFIILLFMYSCKETPEFSIFTKVNLDGTCERTLIVKNIDSDELLSENFPISVDSTWEMTFQVDTILKEDCDTMEKEVDTTYYFHKTFQSVQELNKEYADTNNYYALLNRSMEFKKKFRWFYTYLEYSETYSKLFDGLPMSSFVTKEEYMALESDSDSIPLFEGLDSTAIQLKKDSIDAQFLKWMSSTMFDSYFDALYDHLKATKTLSKYSEGLFKIKDSLYNRYEIFDMSYDAIYEIADSLLEAGGDILSLRENKDSIMQVVYNRYELWAGMLISENFHYALLLPGMLSATNADSIKSDTLQFVFTWDRFFTEDYIMQAETRIINKWSFYVSGAIVLLALITIILGRRKR